MILGPYEMTHPIVSRVPNTPGAYMLGNHVTDRALYVGRADTSLQAQLLAHFSPLPPGNEIVPVQRFWYQVVRHPWEAYYLECDWYHQYAPLHNSGHPMRPLGFQVGCRTCGR